MNAPSTPISANANAARSGRLGVVGVMGLLILVQAVLAGRHVILGDQVIVTHGHIGNAVFVLTLVNLVLAIRARGTGLDFGLAVSLVVLTFAQIGLGYVGRDTLDAAVWHVPNGVLLMGLSAFQLSEVRQRRDG